MTPQRSRLVQRLQPPSKAPEGSALSKLDNVFSFGGGYVNGGLSKGAMDAIRSIFRFDYMGAAEYEFGAVPEAMKKLIEARQQDTLGAFMLEVEGSRAKDAHTVIPHKRMIWFFCDKAPEMVAHVQQFLKVHAAEAYPRREWATRDSTNIHREMHTTWRDQQEPRWSETSGGLELDNGFIYFLNVEQAEKFATLFELQRKAVEGATSSNSDFIFLNR